MAQDDPGFSLLATDPDYYLIAKAPGVNFHSEVGEPGLLVRAESHFGEPLWPVHRLDKMTSGLVLMARSAQAARAFGEAFAQRKVCKYYLAIGRGKARKKQGLVVGDMQKSRRRGWKLLRTSANPAVTQFFSVAYTPGHRLFVLKPHTGKTHQLRVALNSLGCPVAGDDIYDSAHAPLYDRGYLHAWQLLFDWAGERRHYICAPQIGERFLSSDCIRALEQLGSPEQLPWPTVRTGA